MIKCCGNCRYASEHRIVPNTGEAILNCRRYPPNYDPVYARDLTDGRDDSTNADVATECHTVWVFPVVDAVEDWCGEFECVPVERERVTGIN